MEKLTFNDFEINKKWDFGVLSISENELIEFARLVDPLAIHIDKAAAEKSIFKGLVASGPHIFTKFHKVHWLPRLGHTVIAGLGVNNWRLLKPVYVDQEIMGSVIIADCKINNEKKHAVIKWLWEFLDTKNEMVQCLELIILHRIN